MDASAPEASWPSAAVLPLATLALRPSHGRAGLVDLVLHGGDCGGDCDEAFDLALAALEGAGDVVAAREALVAEELALGARQAPTCVSSRGYGSDLHEKCCYYD